MRCSCSRLLTPKMESTGMVDSNSTVFDCMKTASDINVSQVCSGEALPSAQECSVICQAARRSDLFQDLMISFEMVSDTLCQQYRGNILPMEGASIIIRSLVKHGLIKVEYSSASIQGNKDKEHQQRELGFTNQQSIRTESGDCADLGESQSKHRNADTQNLQAWMNTTESTCQHQGNQNDLGKIIKVKKHSQSEVFYSHVQYGTTVEGKNRVDTHNMIHNNRYAPSHEYRKCENSCTRKNHVDAHSNSLIYSSAVLGNREDCGRKCNETKDMKPYQCSVCGKRFKHKSSEKTHMLMHLKNRPHECKECGKNLPTSNRSKHIC
ncbi:zinc finger protein 417-like [Ptychodera flava]|uniref:zinc finger protein 417-like n=1 Tax=Ptychodera flava TaxID=63121 RepID=UPI00396A8956